MTHPWVNSFAQLLACNYICTLSHPSTHVHTCKHAYAHKYTHRCAYIHRSHLPTHIHRNAHTVNTHILTLKHTCSWAAWNVPLQLLLPDCPVQSPYHGSFLSPHLSPFRPSLEVLYGLLAWQQTEGGASADNVEQAVLQGRRGRTVAVVPAQFAPAALAVAAVFPAPRPL
jgi:hypothetical protein